MTTPLSEERIAEMLEQLAAIEHERWSGWMDYQAEHCNLVGIEGRDIHKSGEPFVERWARQAATPYDQLTEAEKESDRIEARKGLGLYQAEVARLRARVAALEGVLRSVEWGAGTWVYDDDGGHMIPTCPRCLAEKREGHAPDCALDAALRGADE